ncbi:hypothetical protein [Sporosarcina phage Lietuvens]|nr:hypothetical protein [Sporosarcina phage Lietuvens]
MSESGFEAIVMAPYYIGLIVMLIFVATVLIPKLKEDKEWSKYDAQWHAYNNAYLQWERNGKIGGMPRYSGYAKDGD